MHTAMVHSKATVMQQHIATSIMQACTMTILLNQSLVSRSLALCHLLKVSLQIESLRSLNILILSLITVVLIIDPL